MVWVVPISLVVGLLVIARLAGRWDDALATWLTLAADVAARMAGCAAVEWSAARTVGRGGFWIAVAIALTLVGALMLLSAAILVFGVFKYGSREQLTRLREP